MGKNTSIVGSYERKNKLIFYKNKLLSRAGWRGWPDSNDNIYHKIDYSLKTEQYYNFQLHQMLGDIKKAIRTLNYKHAKEVAIPIIDKSKEKHRIETEIVKLIDTMKHIDRSKYFVDYSDDNNAKLMLFAEFNGSKRERYSREFDRILVTKSFRHLQYKTQIMVNSASDDQRTRLLHSLEVQRIAKTLSTQLGANSSLAQTIAIGHDVGHAPFGHAGEHALNQSLSKGFFGEFSHALQSVKVLNYIEKHPIMERYGFRGLGLSVEVLSGILRHDTDTFTKDVSSASFRLQYDCPEIFRFYPGNIPSDLKDTPLTMGTLEAQIVYWADKIAYVGHDWEEFVLSNYIDRLLNEMNDVVGEIGEIIAVRKHDSETKILRDLNDIIKDMNQIYADPDSSKEQGKHTEENHIQKQEDIWNKLDICINSLIEKEREMISNSDEAHYTLLSRSDYNLLFDYFKVAQAWMHITKRTPKKYKECNDIIYILYRFFKDTISQRSTPSIEDVLINNARSNIRDLNAKEVVHKSTLAWNKSGAQEIANEPMPEWENKLKAKIFFMNTLVVQLNESTLNDLETIDNFKFRYYIGNKEVQNMIDKASMIICELFNYFLKYPEMLPDEYLEEYFLLIDGQYKKYEILVKQYLKDICLKNTGSCSEIIRDACKNYLDSINDTNGAGKCSIEKLVEILKSESHKPYKEKTSDLGGRHKTLFHSTLASKNKLLDPSSNHVSETILARIIADYICSMTDRMAILKYNEITTSKTSWTENYNA